MSTYYAVLTGDIVKSGQIQPAEYDKLLYQLDQVLRTICSQLNAQYVIYRGDSFQLLLQEKELAVHQALLIFLTLKAVNTNIRISIGLGEVSNLRSDIKSATGPAFTLSGTELDRFKDHVLKVSSYHKTLQAILDTPVKLADKLISQLSARQAEILLHYLTAQDKSHKELAIALNTSRVNITKLLNQANYQLMLDFLDFCKHHIKEQLQ